MHRGESLCAGPESLCTAVKCGSSIHFKRAGLTLRATEAMGKRGSAPIRLFGSRQSAALPVKHFARPTCSCSLAARCKWSFREPDRLGTDSPSAALAAHGGEVVAWLILRIVSHAFEIPSVPAEPVVTLPSDEDGVDHKVYVWTTPLKP
jgi:hypothetical protein